MTIEQAIASAVSVLENAAVENPQREARTLLAFILAKPESFIFAFPETKLQSDQITAFNAVVMRREAREPFHYIVGSREFYGLEFIVTPDVLIPRPETEFLVEAAIEHLSVTAETTFLDIGTGSGCIPVSVLKNVENARGSAVDISPAALGVAKQNAERHGVADRLRFQISDVYSNVGEARFDLITSNPPYIPLDEMSGIQREVAEHEPHIALTDNADGLSIIRRIIADAPTHLNSCGLLLMEIGVLQSELVKDIFSPDIWSDIHFINDLQQIPRVVAARRA